MHTFCRSLLSLLAVGCPLVAGAATIRTSDPNFTYVDDTPSSFMFSTCPTGSDPGGAYMDGQATITGDGCFGGINNSGAPITQIALTFENTEAIQNSGPAVADGGDLFASATVIPPSDPTNSSEFYTYVFSGSELAAGEPFVIVEDGVNPASDFPTVTLTYANVTPEPSSILLLGTGLGCMAALYHRRSRA